MAFDHISKYVQRIVTDVYVRHIDCTQEEAENNVAAAHQAARHDMSFLCNGDAARCDIVCPDCELGFIDTLCVWYASNPFGCPECGPAEKREMYRQRAENDFRKITRQEWEKDVVKRLKRAVFEIDEADRGPIWGRIKRIEKNGLHGEDYRWAREMLTPDEALVE